MPNKVVATLDQLAARGTPVYVRFDNGPEFVADAVEHWRRFKGTDTMFIDPGSPWQNAWIESFNSRLRDELLNGWQFDSLLEAQVIIEDWRVDATCTDPTLPTAISTPIEYAQAWDRDQPTPSRITPGPTIGSRSSVLERGTGTGAAHVETGVATCGGTMNRARLVGISSVAIVVLASGACGSAAKSASSAATATTSPVTKLDLASAGKAVTLNAGAAILPVRPLRYVLDARLADLGTNAAVWRMHPHSVTAADVQRFADVFGLTGSPTHTSTGWQVQGTSAVLSFISDGDVTVSYDVGVFRARSVGRPALRALGFQRARSRTVLCTSRHPHRQQHPFRHLHRFGLRRP